MRPVVLRPLLAEGLPLSLVFEGFHRQNEAVNKISVGMGCSYRDRIKAFKNSNLEFYITSSMLLLASYYLSIA